MSALLRAVRQQRGLTLDQLAEATGLTKSYLSKVERQRSTPSIAVAMKVATALDVDVAQLFSNDPEVTTLSVERGDVRPTSRYHAVAAAMLGKTMSPFVVRPTREFVDHPHSTHRGQEFIFVHSGVVEVQYGDQAITLKAGDCAYFDSSVPHQMRQLGDDKSEVVVVTHDEYSRDR